MTSVPSMKTVHPVMALVGCKRSGRTGPSLKTSKSAPYARYCSISSRAGKD